MPLRHREMQVKICQCIPPLGMVWIDILPDLVWVCDVCGNNWHPWRSDDGFTMWYCDRDNPV